MSTPFRKPAPSVNPFLGAFNTLAEVALALLPKAHGVLMVHSDGLSLDGVRHVADDGRGPA